jgi:hypothetical protein
MMRQPLWAAAALLAVSFASGSLAPHTPPRPLASTVAGYQVLSADFHVHSFPLSWSTLSPFDTVFEAHRQGLDAIAMSGHNNVWVSQVGRWFSRLIGGPIVLTAEEVHAPSYHMVAVGIEHAVSWRQSAAAAIDDIHRQGGIAIAAHPIIDYWPGWDTEAMRRLDAAEVVHPVAFNDRKARLQLRQFFARRKLTAIGSSDFHYTDRMGHGRTYVFVTERSERGVLDALRQGHTVVYDRDGRVFGDPQLIALGVVPKLVAPPSSGFWSHLSLMTGVLGLLLTAAVLHCSRAG